MTTVRVGAAIEVGLPVAETARQAEELGFDLVAIGEHVAFHIPTSNSFVALAVAAGATRTIRLLSSVALLPLYPAALAAKLVAELAHHSAGRFDLGVGMGGEFPAEFEACGVPLAERAPRLEEGLEVIRRLLREDDVSFAGRFTTLGGITITPRPERPPAVWMGGRKAKAMERAARLADVWMPYLYTPDQLAESIATIRRSAGERHGRDPADVGAAVYAWTCVDDSRKGALDRAARVLSTNYGSDMRGATERYAIAGTPAECLAQARDYVSAGAGTIIFTPIADDAAGRLRALEVIGTQVAPALRDS